MLTLRVLLIALYIPVAIYFVIAGMNHGWNMFEVFLADLADMTWRGQFNLDFTSYLILTSSWIAWRHKFTPAGLGLALLGLVSGMMFLSLYLLYMSFKANGDIKVLLLGQNTAH